MKKLAIANWKLNKNESEIKDWFEEFSKLYKPVERVRVVVCPSHVYLGLVKNLIDKYSLGYVSCGAQDASVYLSGSHTGDVSVSQVKEFSQFCIVGHSERGEDRSSVNIKVNNCLKDGLVPILCVREVSMFKNVYEDKVILTWEDPSNISSSEGYKEKPQSEIEEGINQIRQKVGSIRPLIYGGSVNEENSQRLARIDGVSGFLVGHASLEPKTFVRVVESLSL